MSTEEIVAAATTEEVIVFLSVKKIVTRATARNVLASSSAECVVVAPTVEMVVMLLALQEVVSCTTTGAGKGGIDDNVVVAWVGYDFLVRIYGFEVDLAALFRYVGS